MFSTHSTQQNSDKQTNLDCEREERDRPYIYTCIYYIICRGREENKLILCGADGKKSEKKREQNKNEYIFCMIEIYGTVTLSRCDRLDDKKSVCESSCGGNTKKSQKLFGFVFCEKSDVVIWRDFCCVLDYTLLLL